MTSQDQHPIASAKGSVVAHYDETYWAYQQRSGEFGGWALAPLFSPYILPTDRVVDFGCGGGYLLKSLRCGDRIGVEVNETARTIARDLNGVRTVMAIRDLPDAEADVIISNHALEHCTSPYNVVAELLSKLKPGGIFVAYVPHESNRNPWTPDSVDNHLYTWNPMTFGNLFANAGYQVVSAQPFHHAWPPFHTVIAKGGREVFGIASRIYAMLDRRYSQVKVVARRPT
jgi:SAM-dependent methyltransferase